MRKYFRLVCALAALGPGGPLFAAADETDAIVRVRHAPTLNARIEGSVQQLAPESVTLNGGAVVTGDLLVPGTPLVRLNGNPNYGGTLDAGGAALPSGYQVTLNGNATLRHVVRRTDPVALPAVDPPPTPTGTRTVTINAAGAAIGDFTTLRHLTLNGNADLVTVPPGAYGDFTANGSGGFALGVVGATQPSPYSFQHLTLNGAASLRVVGPVIVTLANGLIVNATSGALEHPSWFVLNFASGGLTINGSATLAGYVVAPNGAVTLNGSAELLGGVLCDRLTVNGNARLRLQPQAVTNPPPPALPYFTSFEAANGYALGGLGGQDGWTARGSALVTDAFAFDGLRSVALAGGAPPAQAVHEFPPYDGRPIVFVDFYTRPVAGLTPASAGLFESDFGQVAFVQNGLRGEFFVLNGDGIGNATWQPTGFTLPIGSDGQANVWIRLTLRADFGRQRWDLYVGGAMLVADRRFVTNTSTQLTRLAFNGPAIGTLAFDDLFAGFENPIFADADRDGIDDAWELGNGMDITVDDRQLDRDGDGLTNLAEYLLGTRANVADTDGDGVADGIELAAGRDPLRGVVADTTGVVNLRLYLPLR